MFHVCVFSKCFFNVVVVVIVWNIRIYEIEQTKANMNMRISYFILVLLNTFLLNPWLIALTRCSSEEERLIKTLFKGYNKLIRPVRNSSDHVVITMDLVLLQLINVVSKLKTYFFIYQYFGLKNSLVGSWRLKNVNP